MDADDDLQLNLAGFEQPASKPSARAKGNRHTVSFKKQQKVLGRFYTPPRLRMHKLFCLSAHPALPQHIRVCCRSRSRLNGKGKVGTLTNRAAVYLLQHQRQLVL